jgi:cyclase
MPAKRVIACLDVDGGRVVKGRRFLNVRDAGDPVELAARYCEQGADELVVLDISASLEDRLAAQHTVAAIARVVDVPLTVGGGVRDPSDVARLLDAGADKVAINSAALARPQLIAEAAQRFGSQCVVVAVDARRGYGSYPIASHGARIPARRCAQEWASQAQALGAGELLITSIDCDGERRGFDVELIARLRAVLSIPIIASGGARDAASFVQAFAAGADAALGASVFHFGMTSVGAVKRACADAGIVVRP